MSACPEWQRAVEHAVPHGMRDHIISPAASLRPAAVPGVTGIFLEEVMHQVNLFGDGLVAAEASVR